MDDHIWLRALCHLPPGGVRCRITSDCKLATSLLAGSSASRAAISFGNPRQELLGLSVDILVPGRFPAYHPAHRTGYAANQQVLPMGAGLNLYGFAPERERVPSRDQPQPAGNQRRAARVRRGARRQRLQGGRGASLGRVVDGLDEDQGMTTGADAHSIAAMLPTDPPGTSW
ncbi:MAG TPA: hypothetical protein VIV12_08730 [Streptosporangiaceae bacterium]